MNNTFFILMLFCFCFVAFWGKGVRVFSISLIFYDIRLYNFPLIFADGCFENNHCSRKEGILLE